MLLSDLVNLAPALHELYPQDFQTSTFSFLDPVLCDVSDFMNGTDIHSHLRRTLVAIITRKQPRTVPPRDSLCFFKVGQGCAHLRRSCIRVRQVVA